MHAIKSREERPVDRSIHESGYVYSISSTRVPCIRVQSPLCPTSFSNCFALSIDIRICRFTIALSLWLCYTLTYAVRFLRLIFRGGTCLLSSELPTEDPRETLRSRENVSHRSPTSCSYYRETTS